MVTFQFPPYAGSSAVQRTLRFVKHLPSLGWEAIVLTATPRAYETTSDDLVSEVPPGTIVARAAALDVARHLSIFGKYPTALARPDRWNNWRIDGVRAGLSLIERYSPAMIWSTFPIPTAHDIAGRLHQRSGLPWIADFRDPMAQDGYPEDPKTWQSFKAIEERTVRAAARSVFTTPSAVKTYRERYADMDPNRIVLIENGFDEESFSVAAELARGTGPLNPGCFTLLHSGVVYGTERDPTQLFAALGRLREQGRIDSDRLRIRFRAPVHVELLRRLAADNRIEGIVEILPMAPYKDALQEMVRADALLVMQAACCNEQIPAKLYEYLRAGRPILGLTDIRGDTAQTLRSHGVNEVAALADEDEIAAIFCRILDEPSFRTSLVPNAVAARQASREARTAQLASLFDAALTDAGRR